MKKIGKVILWGILILTALSLFGKDSDSSSQSTNSEAGKASESAEKFSGIVDSSSQAPEAPQSDILADLDKTVTEDWLPGTYKGVNGELFSIRVHDESVLDTNDKHPKWFFTKTKTICNVVLPDYTGMDEEAILDCYDKTIEVPGSDGIYNVELEKKHLKLTMPDRVSYNFTKISDEPMGKRMREIAWLNTTDIAGVYAGKYDNNGINACDGFIKILDNSDGTVNVYVFPVESIYDMSEYEAYDPRYDRPAFGSPLISQLYYVAKNVPMETFTQDGYVKLRGKDPWDTSFIWTSSRNTVGVEDRVSRYSRLKGSEAETITKIVDDFIETVNNINPETDFRYESFADDIGLVEFMQPSHEIPETFFYDQPFSFYHKWYEIYRTFGSESSPSFETPWISLEIQEKDGTVQMLIYGQVYRTFGRYNYSHESDGLGNVQYICNDGSTIAFSPIKFTGGEQRVRFAFEKLDDWIIDEIKKQTDEKYGDGHYERVIGNNWTQYPVEFKSYEIYWTNAFEDSTSSNPMEPDVNVTGTPKYNGEWKDQQGQDISLNIICQDDVNYNVTIDQSISREINIHWEFTANYDAQQNCLVYRDASKFEQEYIFYPDRLPDVEQTEVYSNGRGTLTLWEEGVLLWQDFTEGAGAGYSFTKD